MFLKISLLIKIIIKNVKIKEASEGFGRLN